MKHLEELAAATQTAVELELRAHENILAAQAAIDSSDSAQKQAEATSEEVKVIKSRQAALSEVLKNQSKPRTGLVVSQDQNALTEFDAILNQATDAVVDLLAVWSSNITSKKLMLRLRHRRF